MKTEIISIGSELTSGQNLDTNAQWLSRRLSSVGFDVGFHTTVGDNRAENLAVFQTALERAEVILVTGGLGPTADDLTREVLADLAGVELVLDPNSLSHLQEMFRKRNRPMPERNRVQAYFPSGSTPIPNAMGTAPGIWMERPRPVSPAPRQATAIIVCLPGVPAEMFPMFNDWVLPRLLARGGGGKATVHHTLRCFGAGESHIEEKLGDMIRRGRYPEVGITASEGTISLRVTATAETPELARQQIEPDTAFIRAKLGDLIFGENDDELYTVVAQLLADRRLTLATAESCTGGLVGHLLTEVAGISSHYLGGVVSYSNEAKRDLLGVPADLLATHGAVSEQVAAAMAEGCRRRFGSDLALAITGIAGPGGGTPQKPVGLVHVALAHTEGIRAGRYDWAAGRSSIKIRAAKTALNLLRLHLLQWPR